MGGFEACQPSPFAYFCVGILEDSPCPGSKLDHQTLAPFKAALGVEEAGIWYGIVLYSKCVPIPLLKCFVHTYMLCYKQAIHSPTPKGKRN